MRKLFALLLALATVYPFYGYSTALALDGPSPQAARSRKVRRSAKSRPRRRPKVTYVNRTANGAAAAPTRTVTVEMGMEAAKPSPEDTPQIKPPTIKPPTKTPGSP